MNSSSKFKTCSKCGNLRSFSEFYKASNTKDGLNTVCKFCCKAYDKSRYTSDVIRKRYLQNRQYYKNYTEQNKIQLKHYRQEYYNKTKNKLAAKAKEKKAKDVGYRINCNLSTALSRILRDTTGKLNSDYFLSYLVYSKDEFRSHIESQFTSEMSWNNYGTYWGLDHIIPKNQFHFESYDDKEFKLCWSLMNLRPLSIEDNLKRPKDGSDVSEDLRLSILNQKIYEVIKK